ncbi:Protein phosphatase 1 regulatory subunit 12A [Operophtera brumata]|uniref:Protein phosphatase 1 regulatory subunit 12A n=1 Tax=Operophtera brumata TaxID=104452 RepID=A0A0L7L6U6_OPEBR|nr:Protein phosphatase 1 regulatory subunit 12A [Operophtera brumata]
MSRKQDRYTSRPRSLTSHYGSSPSMLGSVLGSQYGSYGNSSYPNYSSSKYRNYNPYSAGFGRSSSNLGIYGGTSSGYGGVYLSGSSLGSLNLMTPVLKKLDKRLLASQKNFKPKPVPPAKVQEVPPEEVEVRRLRALLATSDTQLRCNSSITRLAQVNQNSVSENEKREKRAMERKLSEMEEELKQLQKLKAENERLRAENRALTRVLQQSLQAENQRLKDENGALIRVISKLSK